MDEVVAGLPGADLDGTSTFRAARTALEGRYSQAAVGRRLLDHYLSTTPTGRNER